MGNVVALFLIGKARILKYDMLCFRNRRRLFYRQILPGIEHFTDSGSRSASAGIHDKQPGDGKHSVENDGKVAQKSDNHAHLGHACIDPERTDHHHQRQAGIEEQVHHGVGNAHGNSCPGFPAHHFPIDLCKMFFFLFCPGKGFDDPNSGNILPDGPHHGVHALLQIGVHGNAFPGYQPHHQPDKGHNGHHHQCQHRLHTHGHQHTPHQQNRSTHAQPLHHADYLIDVIGVGGQPGFQRRNGESINLAAGQP